MPRRMRLIAFRNRFPDAATSVHDAQSVLLCRTRGDHVGQ